MCCELILIYPRVLQAKTFQDEKSATKASEIASRHLSVIRRYDCLLEFAMKEASAMRLAHFNACSTTQCSKTSSAKLTNESSARIVQVRYRLCSVFKPLLLIYAGSQCLAAAVENLCSEYQYTTERAIIPAASIVPLIKSKFLPGYGCTSEHFNCTSCNI